MDDRGRRVKEAGPSQPVEILGLNEVPQAGEVFVGCESEKEARNFAETFISQHRVKMLEETKSKMSLDDLFNQIQEGNLKELNNRSESRCTGFCGSNQTESDQIVK